MILEPAAEEILRRKYYLNSEETFDKLCIRVAYAVAQTEEDKDAVNYWFARYYEIMNNLWFLPAGRILANAGKPNAPSCYNCFVLNIEDSRRSIYKTLATAAEVFALGGGVGINFSSLRERGTPVSQGGTASGPVAFMRLFDTSADIISQTSRRGGILGLLSCDHPDVRQFIRAKEQENVLSHFNLSVGITDEFMRALIAGRPYYLRSRYDSRKIEISPEELFNDIAEYAWKTGDPGFIFTDRLDEDNAAPHLGKIEATNLCGESPLLGGEACDLGSINLTKMLTKRPDGSFVFDEEKFAYTVSVAVRFLDSVHDISRAPIPEIDEAVKKTRKIGLGIFGWADALVILNIPYESKEALKLAMNISMTMKRVAYETSKLLAKEKGAYPAFNPETSRNIWYPNEPVIPTRNAMLLSLAPNGTISLLAGANYSIEPFFALRYTKNMMLGSNRVEYQIENINKYLPDGEIPKDIFKTAHEISPSFRVEMQAVWQAAVDGAISSTINLPNSATVEDVRNIIYLSWRLGLKGTTIFRDGCRSKQIMTTGNHCEICQKF